MEADTSVNRETELVTTTRSNLAENDFGIYNVSARDRDDRGHSVSVYRFERKRSRFRFGGLAELSVFCFFSLPLQILQRYTNYTSVNRETISCRNAIDCPTLCKRLGRFVRQKRRCINKSVRRNNQSRHCICTRPQQSPSGFSSPPLSLTALSA